MLHGLLLGLVGCAAGACLIFLDRVAGFLYVHTLKDYLIKKEGSMGTVSKRIATVGLAPLAPKIPAFSTLSFLPVTRFPAYCARALPPPETRVAKPFEITPAEFCPSTFAKVPPVGPAIAPIPPAMSPVTNASIKAPESSGLPSMYDAIAFSGPIPPLVPIDSGHPIRCNPATYSGAFRPPLKGVKANFLSDAG